MRGDTEEVPPEVHHYTNRSEVPWDIQKYAPMSVSNHLSASTNWSLQCSYWAQRYKIFSKYDAGIWLTDDAWFGVTPEPVAKFVCP
jgi:trimethylguanosine synthase